MKTTRKNAFIMSLTALIMCIAMLIGSTFAWFTDTASSTGNKIVAGTLDIDVKYINDSVNDWKNLDGSDAVFSKGFWEPGHTEFATFKVTNNGSLALKYRVNVSPVSETGGINAKGENFKLSDYLVFGTTAPSASVSNYTRETARAAVGSTMGLSQSSMTTNRTLMPGATEYLDLVVYMPETVGNEANYMTGTTAPQIELGVKFLATQLESEEDSFSDDYDADADYNPAEAAIEYSYFPQVNVVGQLVISSGDVTKGSTAGAETTVTKISDGKSRVVLASVEKIENNAAAKLEAIVDKGNLKDDEKGTLRLKVVKDDTENANFQTKADSPMDTSIQDSTTYQVTVESEGVTVVAPETSTPSQPKAKYKISLFIGQGRNNVKMYHSGVLMTESGSEEADTYTYDSDNGYVVMFVDTFSPFTAVYDLPVAAIGTTVYYSMQAAVDAVTAEETTIKLINDVSGDGVDVPSGKNIIFDFCGHTYTLQGEMVGSGGTKTNGFRFLNGSTVTMKNGKLANGASSLEASTPAKVMINSYCTLTLKDFSVDARTEAIAPTGGPYGSACLYIANGPAVVTGSGTYTGDPDGKVIYMANVEYYTDGAALTFDESFTGTVKGDVVDGGKQTASVSIKAGNYDFGSISFTNGTLAISGGTFTADPSTYVISGYKANDNQNGTWTVKTKPIPVPDKNGVFTVTDNEQLNDVIEELNNPDTTYTSGDYTIKLGAGTFGGTEVEGGWKADVKLIKQYPQWNEKYWTNMEATGSNLSAPPANHRKVTIVGNDSPSERTEMRMIFVIAGFGNSNDGIPAMDETVIKTEFQNIDFDFTKCVGVNSSYESLYKDDVDFSPIHACGASSNVIINNCNFTKIDRIKLGYNKTPGASRNMIENGEIAQLRDHTCDPVVKNCTFTDCDTCIDGYFEQSGKAKFENITFNGESFINSQGACLDTVEILDCSATCSNYFIRTNQGSKFLAKNCVINDTDTSLTNKYGMLTLRGTNNTITFDDCTFTTSKEIRASSSSGHICDSTSVVIMKGTSPTASQMDKTVGESGIDCTIKDYTAPEPG